MQGIMAYKDPAVEKAYRRRKYQENAEANRAKSRRWREANPEKARECAKRWRERPENKDKQRLWRRQQDGVLDATGEARTGFCPICLREKPLVCDHHHGPNNEGNTRGWICDRCNRGLGHLGDTAENVRRALDYLLASQPG